MLLLLLLLFFRKRFFLLLNFFLQFFFFLLFLFLHLSSFFIGFLNLSIRFKFNLLNLLVYLLLFRVLVLLQRVGLTFYCFFEVIYHTFQNSGICSTFGCYFFYVRYALFKLRNHFLYFYDILVVTRGCRGLVINTLL